MNGKDPFVYSGFNRYEEAEAFAAAVNTNGGKAEVITREYAGTREIIVISWELSNDRTGA